MEVAWSLGEPIKKEPLNQRAGWMNAMNTMSHLFLAGANGRERFGAGGI